MEYSLHCMSAAGTNSCTHIATIWQGKTQSFSASCHCTQNSGALLLHKAAVFAFEQFYFMDICFQMRSPSRLLAKCMRSPVRIPPSIANVYKYMPCGSNHTHSFSCTVTFLAKKKLLWLME